MRKHWSWPALTAVAGLGAFTGLAFLVQAIVVPHGGPGAFEFGVWSALIAASAVVFVFLFFHALPLATGWREAGAHGRGPLLCYIAFAMAILAFLWAGGGPITQLRPAAALPVSRVLVLLALTAAAPTVLGLWLVTTRLRRISQALSAPTDPPTRADAVLADLIDCRRATSVCLTVLATIITIAVIDSGAQRKAFLATGIPPEKFPPEWVLLYGALFTAISLLLYVPTFVTWRTRCMLFVDQCYPLPADARPTAAWVEGRTRLISVLGADMTVAKSLTTAFGLLAPLAVSVLSVVVPGLK
ncbi:hypothetical protein [Actinocrispum wychmicini]|uniref:Uncharacterized protein n=1 Tax=Actinocrispum wychmicini TaxID=1213861 RepID=A0A4R2JUK6_9PSEU|nr:hypothetical protein [Actinocrispum wychmicini]TCO60946.1 hypothetical protein EV192_103528 [Actinocrispum wychmicini]